MEFVILGLLGIKEMTLYELRTFIKQNLSAICSDSAGSVHTALKKLLGGAYIVYQEQVQGGINKKSYEITQLGREYFHGWITNPMVPQKAKNMELSKLFFLGMAPKEQRVELIEEYISQLRDMKERFLVIQTFAQSSMQELQETGNVDQRMKDIMKFQYATLEYGLDSVAFEINWYEQLLGRLWKGEI